MEQNYKRCKICSEILVLTELQCKHVCCENCIINQVISAICVKGISCPMAFWGNHVHCPICNETIVWGQTLWNEDEEDGENDDEDYDKDDNKENIPVEQ